MQVVITIKECLKDDKADPSRGRKCQGACIVQKGVVVCVFVCVFFPFLLLLFSVTVITVGIYSVIHSIASTVYILHCTEIKSNYHDPYPHICKHNLASSFFLSLFFSSPDNVSGS